MVRLTRSMALSAYGLGLALVASGCKMTRPEVPPGRPYSSDGRQRPAIGFSSEAHPVNGAALTNVMPDSPGAGKLADGIGSTASKPEVSTLLGGAPGAFGPPGTSGRVGTGESRTSPSEDGSVLPAGAPDFGRPSISPDPLPAAGAPSSSNTVPADAPPQPETDAPRSQVVQPAADDPGKMGRNNDYPSPN